VRTPVKDAGRGGASIGCVAVAAGLAAALLSMGCGDGGERGATAGGGAAGRAPAPVRAQPMPRARKRCTPFVSEPSAQLISFRREVGVDPIQDEVIVEDAGRAVFRRLRGGAGARCTVWRLPTDRLRRLRTLVHSTSFARLRVRSGFTPVYKYLLRRHGRSISAREDALPARLRPLIRALNSIADTPERWGAPPDG
jgi:hypothetical protein